MRRLGVLIFAGLLGAAFSLATAGLADALHLTPNFPAYGGEDDFSFRFTVFGMAVVPAFAALGVWIARAALVGRGGWGRRVLGAVAGTIGALAVEPVLASAIEALPSSDAANTAVMASFAGWLGLAFLGARLAGRRPPV